MLLLSQINCLHIAPIHSRAIIGTLIIPVVPRKERWLDLSGGAGSTDGHTRIHIKLSILLSVSLLTVTLLFVELGS